MPDIISPEGNISDTLSGVIINSQPKQEQEAIPNQIPVLPSSKTPAKMFKKKIAPAQTFKCGSDGCCLKSSYKSNLIRHMKQHNGNKFKCSLCPAEFYVLRQSFQCLY